MEEGLSNDNIMSKRVGLTVPDAVYDRLERWAKADGRPVANLCNFLIEKAVSDAEEKGKIPEPREATPTK
jgi:predicted DNA-binding protein